MLDLMKKGFESEDKDRGWREVMRWAHAQSVTLYRLFAPSGDGAQGSRAAASLGVRAAQALPGTPLRNLHAQKGAQTMWFYLFYQFFLQFLNYTILGIDVARLVL